VSRPPSKKRVPTPDLSSHNDTCRRSYTAFTHRLCVDDLIHLTQDGGDKSCGGTRPAVHKAQHNCHWSRSLLQPQQ
jgi:hypothetical protein